MELLNTNSHRIYADGRAVPSGGRFSGDSDDLDRDGVIDASSDEAQAWLDAHDAGATAGEIDPGPQAVNDVSLLGRGLDTAALRDRLDPETETTVKGTGIHRLNNQPSAGGPDEILRDDVSDPNAPPPISPDPATGAVTTGAPGSDQLADERTHSVPALLSQTASTDAEDALSDEEIDAGATPADEVAESGSLDADSPASRTSAPEYDDGVKFTSGAAENAADAAVAEGKIKASDLKPGGGSGADGAYKVDDLK